MSMIGVDPEETADALDRAAQFAAADLMRQMAAENTRLQARLDAVLALCEQADKAGVTSGGPFTVAAIRNAATDEAALDHTLTEAHTRMVADIINRSNDNKEK